MKKLLIIIAFLMAGMCYSQNSVSLSKEKAPLKIEKRKVDTAKIKAAVNTTIAVVDTASKIIANIDTASIAKSNLPDSTKEAINATVKAAGELATKTETLQTTLNGEKGKVSLLEKIQALIAWISAIVIFFSFLSKAITGLSAWFDLIHKLNQLIIWVVKLFNKKGVVGKQNGVKGTYKEVFVPDEASDIQ